MKSIMRLYLDRALEKYLKRIQGGSVLSIGDEVEDHSYKKRVRYDNYKVLDIDPKYKPDIICDVHDMKPIQNNTFNAIIASEILEHCHNPQKVADEFYRILKKGGALVLTTPFLFPYHPAPKDYFRFTKDSLRQLFKKFKQVEVTGYGGRLVFFLEMISWKLGFTKIFNPIWMRLNVDDQTCPCGFIVYAVK